MIGDTKAAFVSKELQVIVEKHGRLRHLKMK